MPTQSRTALCQRLDMEAPLDEEMDHSVVAFVVN